MAIAHKSAVFEPYMLHIKLQHAACYNKQETHCIVRKIMLANELYVGYLFKHMEYYQFY